MHVFPDLKRLERKYAKELVVIGVHSAKFPNEKLGDCIREAILRHGIEHPVVNDDESKIMTAYRRFGARGWPTFILIGPTGNYIGVASGEGNYEVLDGAIAAKLKEYGGRIDRKEMAFTLEKSKVKDGPLSYPGKVVAAEDRLYVADTNHNRIVVTDHRGKVLEVVGGPEEGRKDGDFAAARFFQPQGLALRGTSLFVADRENHLLREVDFKARAVRTIAGTGKQGRRRGGEGDALATGLNSPWDLALEGDRLFIAMAGSHQIWVMDLRARTVGPFSGTGGEDIVDGDHASAEYAQPSGLAIHDGKLYVADSEVSGIREADLDPKGSVRTIVGKGLFEFGDKDGTGDDVRLQHTLGVLWHRGKLYVCDAYNHKIKVCTPGTREVTTLLGDGHRGKADGKNARFFEPSGLAAWGDSLFVADQNNHAIRVCDLKTGEVRTLAIEKP